MATPYIAELQELQLRRANGDAYVSLDMESRLAAAQGKRLLMFEVGKLNMRAVQEWCRVRGLSCVDSQCVGSQTLCIYWKYPGD